MQGGPRGTAETLAGRVDAAPPSPPGLEAAPLPRPVDPPSFPLIVQTPPSVPERLLRLVVAGLVLASPVVVPLLHAADGAGGPQYATQEDGGSSFQHDHALCIQLQGSSARPAAPPVAPSLPGRTALRSACRSTRIGSLPWRSIPRARAPPTGVLS